MKAKNKAKKILHDGVFKTIAQLAKQYSLSKQVVEHRLRQGIDLAAPKYKGGKPAKQQYGI